MRRRAAVWAAVVGGAFGDAFPRDGASCTLRVDAAAALHAAAESISALASSGHVGNVTVCISGTHLLTAPLLLTAAHSLPDGAWVRWVGADARSNGGDDAARLSGGFAVDDAVWVASAEGYSIAIDSKPRQLWLAGARIPRSVLSAEKLAMVLPYTQDAEWHYTSDDAASLQHAEFVWRGTITAWTEPRCPVVSVSQGRLRLEETCWFTLWNRNGHKHPGRPTAVEGSVENVAWSVADASEAAFFADGSTANFHGGAKCEACSKCERCTHCETCRPRSAVFGSLQTLLALDGASRHMFKNLAFEHSTWWRPEGLVGRQALVHWPDAYSLNAAKGNGLYALEVGNASQRISVVRCRFDDLSGGAVYLGGVDDERAISKDEEDWDSNLVVAECRTNSTGLEFAGAPAIFAGYVALTSLENNLIENTAYSGISLGWGWGIAKCRVRSFARLNAVRGNVVRRPLRSLGDGGCYYTLGPQSGTTIIDNICEGSGGQGIGAFYLDTGSEGIEVSRNVVSETAKICLVAKGRGNAVDHLWCRGTANELWRDKTVGPSAVNAPTIFRLRATE
ncbi:hypothetical protein M885DRAFT_589872, partial [Pelagophyceae sp. CCMP2097]